MFPTMFKPWETVKCASLGELDFSSAVVFVQWCINHQQNKFNSRIIGVYLP